MDEDEEAARQQSLVDLEQLYEWLQQFEDPTIGESTYIRNTSETQVIPLNLSLFFGETFCSTDVFRLFN